MSTVPRPRPLSTRLLALLAAWVLLGAQLLASTHVHAHDAAHPAHELYLHEGHEGEDGEATASACALCLLQAAAHEWAPPPAGAAFTLPSWPREAAPAADGQAPAACRFEACAPARGPPGLPQRA
jgi:hypothetical protein